MPRKSRKVIYLILFLVFNVLLFEGLSYVGLKYLQRHGIFYSYEKVTKTAYEDYLGDRDENLGWPGKKILASRNPQNGRPRFDRTGSRFIPAYPDPDLHPSCVSLYGDSFTWGAEVAADQTWSNVLSQLLHCRVANYGMWGYGTDQAYLRFLQNTHDPAKIVILGYLTENILRNVNQYRNLVFPEGPFTLKPRFIRAHGGKLQLLPLPTFTYEQFLEVMRSPERYLTHEFFLPGGPAGNFTIEFPYTVTLLKGILKNYHLRAKFLGVPHVAEFYQEEHPSQALPLTLAILKNFSHEAWQRKQHPLILIIPTGPELLYYQKHSRFSYDNLTKLLEMHNLAYLDAGPQILQFLQGRDPSLLFTHISRHFNSEGNRVLAEIVYEYVKSRGWLRQLGQVPSPETRKLINSRGGPEDRRPPALPSSSPPHPH